MKTADEVAELLHDCGLNAYQDYIGMGRSYDDWAEFRLAIAEELLKRVIIKRSKPTPPALGGGPGRKENYGLQRIMESSQQQPGSSLQRPAGGHARQRGEGAVFGAAA